MKMTLELKRVEEIIYYELLNDKKFDDWIVKDIKSLAKSIASTLYLNKDNKNE